jgi:hypothetical protein
MDEVNKDSIYPAACQNPIRFIFCMCEHANTTEYGQVENKVNGLTMQVIPRNEVKGKG